MGQLRVVEHQSVTHFLVKQGQIGEEQIFVVVNEAFWMLRLNRSQCAFIFGVLGYVFQCMRPGQTCVFEVPFELTAVVGEGFTCV